ncbi:MAG: serine/threonine protein kinase, partial [Armatimonadetes bacterium]|nr:serine/threonine protein kinase [Armatimonadota bacterium]
MVGSTLDSRYRLERELRADADGVEYAGVDLRLQRPVRVRMLQLGRAADAGYVAAWRDALTRLAGLSHPGILPLYDICLDGEAPYVVEALVDGASLDERLRAGERIGPAQVAAIARQCGRALGAAHAAGLVHGHVSPAAILVDAAGDAFVTGFGLPEGPSVSREQARYLAPEQSVGQPASPRTDIYGLSATLYELLSGRPPFDGPNAVAIGTLKNTADAPPLPEAAAGRALLEAIRSGLSRHTLARPANGSAFAAAVESAAAAAPPPAAALTQTAVLPRTPAARPLGTSPTAGPRPLSPPVPAPRESGGCGGAVIALLLLVGIGAALVYALKHPGGNIPVPALTGKTETEAK